MTPNTLELRNQYSAVVKRSHARADSLAASLPDYAVRTGLGLADAVEQHLTVAAAEATASSMLRETKTRIDSDFRDLLQKSSDHAAACRRIRLLGEWVKTNGATEFPAGDLPQDLVAACMAIKTAMTSTTSEPERKELRDIATGLVAAALAAEREAGEIRDHATKNLHATRIAMAKGRLAHLRRQADLTADDGQRMELVKDADRLDRRVTALKAIYKNAYHAGGKP